VRSLELANHVRLTDGLSLAQQSQRTLLTASLVRRNRLLLLAIHHHRRGAVLAVGGRHGMRPSGDDVVSEKKKLQSATVCGERLQVRTRRRQCLKEVRANGRLVSAALDPFSSFSSLFSSSLFSLPSSIFLTHRFVESASGSRTAGPLEGLCTQPLQCSEGLLRTAVLV